MQMNSQMELPILTDDELVEYILDNFHDYYDGEVKKDSICDEETLFGPFDSLRGCRRPASSYKDTDSLSDMQCQYPPRVGMQKVVMRDIRRSYADMFVNVFNSADIDLTERFFRTFSISSLAFEQSCHSHHDRHSDVPSYFKIDGMAVFLQFWFNRMHLVPDGVMNISNTKVVTSHYSEGSVVSCEMTFRATKVQDFRFEAAIPTEKDKQELLSLPRVDDKNSNSGSNIDFGGGSSIGNKCKLNVGKIHRRKLHLLTGMRLEALRDNHQNTHIYDYSLLNSVEHASLLSVPIPICARGVLKIHLNANKVITMVSFNNCHPFLQ